MEFNPLPKEYQGIQKRKTTFDSQGDKLDCDAKNLRTIANAQSEKFRKVIDPLTLSRRADDDIEALRVAIAKGQEAVNSPLSQSATDNEAIETNPRLITFKEDFDKDPYIRAKCSWTEIQARLLANDGHYLALAQAMEQGGELFGVDAEGNPLIADRGDEPIMKGMNYKNTRDRVLYKHTSNDKDGTIILGEDDKPISTGYEMFPYAGDYDKSTEILQYEAHTGKPFVKSHNGTESRSSWAESGENPSWPRDVYFDPGYGDAGVSVGDPRAGLRYRGVRRLLRVKKA